MFVFVVVVCVSLVAFVLVYDGCCCCLYSSLLLFMFKRLLLVFVGGDDCGCAGACRCVCWCRLV